MGQAEEMLRDKYPQGHPEFFNLVMEELSLHNEKNADYAQGGDPLGNFKRVSEILGLWGMDCPPYLVGLIYMMKQVDAVGKMMLGHYEGKVETAKSRLQDISVYAKLIQILLKERH